MKDFSTRLKWCKERGDMTVSDLAVWFDRPVATVRTWVEGRTPKGPAGRLAVQWLDLLSSWIRNNAGFPIPAELTQQRRATYIRDLRNAGKRHVSVSPMRASA